MLLRDVKKKFFFFSEFVSSYYHQNTTEFWKTEQIGISIKWQRLKLHLFERRLANGKTL